MLDVYRPSLYSKYFMQVNRIAFIEMRHATTPSEREAKPNKYRVVNTSFEGFALLEPCIPPTRERIENAFKIAIDSSEENVNMQAFEIVKFTSIKELPMKIAYYNLEYRKCRFLSNHEECENCHRKSIVPKQKQLTV